MNRLDNFKLSEKDRRYVWDNLTNCEGKIRFLKSFVQNDILLNETEMVKFRQEVIKLKLMLDKMEDYIYLNREVI